MDKGKIEAMVTKFSEKFAIIMLKKHRKFCRCGLIHLDATSIFKKIVQILMGRPVVTEEYVIYLLQSSHFYLLLIFVNFLFFLFELF